MKKNSCSEWGAICGVASIGPRGQIVIPKEARDKLNMQEGERFLVIEHYGKLILAPEKTMKEMVVQLTKQISESFK
jgi:AbrB family looped-hinge helix DNA binding protein